MGHRCFRHTELDNQTEYAKRLLMVDKLKPTDPRVREAQRRMRELISEMQNDGHSDNYDCPDQS